MKALRFKRGKKRNRKFEIGEITPRWCRLVAAALAEEEARA